MGSYKIIAWTSMGPGDRAEVEEETAAVRILRRILLDPPPQRRPQVAVAEVVVAGRGFEAAALVEVAAH